MNRAPIVSLFMLVAASGCGADSPPPSGEPDAGGCPAGHATCDDACVDLQEDPAHCGSCGNACGGDAPFCVDGVCVDRCRPLANCDGVCVSLRSDPAHCGSCDRVCGDEAPFCGEGECFARCPNGIAPCGEGECPDTTSDPRHCGGCDNACGAEQRCQDGQCVSDEPCLDEGLTLCDDRCVDTAADEDNCGRCDRECFDGQECVGGECVGECGGGGETALCDGECVELESDPANCGECGVVCELDQLCVGGECSVVEPTECVACPCEECDDDQRCCEHDEQVVCVAGDECPED